MSPFLAEGNAIIIYKFSYVLKSPKIGDIVVIKNPEKDPMKQFVVKRIAKSKNRQMYVLGDNKQYSYDSRHYGWIDQNMILGKMIKKL